jgi:hypothetical protein
LTAWGVRAQDTATQMRQAAQQFDQWMSIIGEFIRGVEFNEADVRRLIEHWSDFEALDISRGEGIGPDEFRAEIERVQTDETYRLWANSIGADPDTWLRKGMRIQTAVMQDQAATMRAQWEAERTRQAATLEAQCASLGPEACAEMKGVLQAGSELADKMLAAREKLPKPTAAEQALIDKYRLQILSVVGSK